MLAVNLLVLRLMTYSVAEVLTLAAASTPLAVGL
jgi:hypothetical protein